MSFTVGACGGGTNTTAYLIRWVNEGRRLDLVLFADTGGEKPETYKHIEVLSDWLESKGYGRIITVKYVTKEGNELLLEQRCLDKKMLPSIAYGYKKCSLKFKVAPQDKFVNNWPESKAIFKDKKKVTKLIGYDAGEEHRVLNAQSLPESKKYNYKYPLYEWGWGRKECIEAIKNEGMELPGKSSCFFCPSMKQMEIRHLASKHPDLMARAIAMEDNAMPNLRTVKGLGRDFSWKKFIRQGEMFPNMFPQPDDEMCCGCYDG